MNPLPTTPNYSLEEVEALVEGYAELDPLRVRLWILVRLCDLDLAMRRLSPTHYKAVLLVGLLGVDIRTAGSELGVSHVTVWRQYKRGLERLTNLLNGV